MRRAARQDGWLPNYAPVGVEGPRPADDRWTPALPAEGVGWIRDERERHGLAMDDYDIVAEGMTAADDSHAADQVRPWADAGANWWIEADWSSMDPELVRRTAERRLRAGPPRID